MGKDVNLLCLCPGTSLGTVLLFFARSKVMGKDKVQIGVHGLWVDQLDL